MAVQLEHEQESTTSVQTEVEVRADEVRHQIDDAKEQIDTGFADLSRLLLEAYNGAYWKQWGFESFKEYCDEDLGVGIRRAQYMIGIARVVKEHKLNWNDVVEIGWTRMRAITKAIEHKYGERTPEQWLDMARDHTADQLSEMVKKAREGVETEGEEKIVSIQLRMNADTAAIVMDAVDHAKNIYDSKSVTAAIESISYDWLQQSGEGPTKTPLETAVKWLEEQYGVKLNVESGQNLNDMVDD